MTTLEERPAATPGTPALAGEPAGIPPLSASRGADFKVCPLRYRFRVVDRLKERPSPEATRGSVVHAALEHLFDLPAAERTLQAALDLVAGQWAAAQEAEPDLAQLFAADAALAEAEWLESARDLVRTYFTLEDPRRIEPAEREAYVRGSLPALGIEVHGYLDRIDVTASGDVVVSDYKTGRSPAEHYQEQALFQMKFYALMLWRVRGTLPRRMRLIYLGDGVHCTYEPDPDNLARFERSQLGALRAAIDRATATGDWRPRRSRLCDWCDFQALCPEFGGTPPPLPALVAAPVDAVASREAAAADFAD